MLSEGFKPNEIIQNFIDKGVDVAKSTIYDWAKEFRNLSGNNGRISIPIDPESPLQRIINAMWDVHSNPTEDGAQIKVNVLNGLLRAEQFRCQVEVSKFDPDELSDAELEKISKGA